MLSYCNISIIMDHTDVFLLQANMANTSSQILDTLNYLYALFLDLGPSQENVYRQLPITFSIFEHSGVF